MALIHAADWLLIGLLQPKHRHDVFPVAQLVVDSLGAAAVLGFAVVSRRVWMAVMAAFLLLGVAGYANFLTANHGWHRAYVTATYVWGYSALASLAYGAWSGRRRPT